ncbi:MAG: membrane protein insertion efficiency factor YidD, partial [Treponema sp.]|nr:membrane protein insertion efficiency factor YidD [Treponema sp.]
LNNLLNGGDTRTQGRKKYENRAKECRKPAGFAIKHNRLLVCECEARPKERDEVRAYCCERELERPKTNIKIAIVSTMIFLVVVLIVSFSAIHLVFWLGVQWKNHWIASHSAVTCLLTCAVCFVLCFMLILKRMIIGIVRLYQHYAPEEVRRKCILKPTCSEYIILAIEKYGVFRGVKKGVYRLLYTCRMRDYRIDEP